MTMITIFHRQPKREWNLYCKISQQVIKWLNDVCDAQGKRGAVGFWVIHGYQIHVWHLHRVVTGQEEAPLVRSVFNQMRKGCTQDRITS